MVLLLARSFPAVFPSCSVVWVMSKMSSTTCSSPDTVERPSLQSRAAWFQHPEEQQAGGWAIKKQLC